MNFYSSDRQLIVGPVYLLPQAGSDIGGSRRPLNSYAILRDGYSILFDAGYPWALDGIARFAEEGYPPHALVLSHRDTARAADALDTIRSTYDIPILLNPLDANDTEVHATGIAFQDPVTAPVLREANIDCLPLPGHTPGSIMLYLENEGGIVLTGDCAVGPGPEQGAGEPDAEPQLQRTLMSEEDERVFIPAWHKAMASLPVAAVLPLHGQCYLLSETGDARFATLLSNVTTGVPMDPRQP